jgi:hypothetical protein
MVLKMFFHRISNMGTISLSENLKIIIQIGESCNPEYIKLPEKSCHGLCNL